MIATDISKNAWKGKASAPATCGLEGSPRAESNGKGGGREDWWLHREESDRKRCAGIMLAELKLVEISRCRNVDLILMGLLG